MDLCGNGKNRNAMTIFEKMEKMPLVLKVIIGGIPILLVIIYSFFLSNRGTKNREQFYIQGFSSTVLRSNTSLTGRATEFHLSNGLKIYFGFSTNSTIGIGDSIRKEPNTYMYDVYRKDVTGEYKFLATYNFEETL